MKIEKNITFFNQNNPRIMELSNNQIENKREKQNFKGNSDKEISRIPKKTKVKIKKFETYVNRCSFSVFKNKYLMRSVLNPPLRIFTECYKFNVIE